MKLTNFVIYCRGWYKQRDNSVKSMWKDIAHCMMCDGYLCTNKRQIIQNLMMFMTDSIHQNKSLGEEFSFSKVFEKIEKNKFYNNVGYESEKLDEYDYIIWALRDVFRYIDISYFNSGVKPDSNVLPINTEFHTIEEINEIFKDYDEQDVDKMWGENYEDREQMIIANEKVL